MERTLLDDVRHLSDIAKALNYYLAALRAYPLDHIVVLSLDEAVVAGLNLQNHLDVLHGLATVQPDAGADEVQP